MTSATWPRVREPAREPGSVSAIGGGARERRQSIRRAQDVRLGMLRGRDHARACPTLLQSSRSRDGGKFNTP